MRRSEFSAGSNLSRRSKKQLLKNCKTPTETLERSHSASRHSKKLKKNGSFKSKSVPILPNAMQINSRTNPDLNEYENLTQHDEI